MTPDLLVASGQVVLTLLAWMMLLQRGTYVHPLISMLSTLALTHVAMGLILLSAPVSGAIAFTCAVAWLGIALTRGTRHGLR